jgi:acetyl-CoA carboxylase biotin carboxylase subunit
VYQRILIANRGAAAARILRAVTALGREPVILHSPADAELPYLFDVEAVEAPGNRPQQSYLDQDFILDAARKLRVDAIHPGYGFLSENAEFAHRVCELGIGFIGPSAETIAAMGHKESARRVMADAGLPMVPSSGVLGDDPDELQAAADSLGLPLLIKPANGGGGIGMFRVCRLEDVVEAVTRARSLAGRAFGDPAVYLERLVERPRHIEFQILADDRGGVRHLFERDCSLQRRYQKVVEEAGAPGLSRAELDAMAERVAAAIAAIGYRTLGTVEMLYHPDAGFSFLEMNTRLQVEHSVTEEVTGTDLVAAQIRLAEGATLDELDIGAAIAGHAIEARIYAEDPVRFLPSPGRLETFAFPAGDGVRLETGYEEGCTVTPFYDPMIAKLICRGPDRATAIARLRDALDETAISGIKTNIPLLKAVTRSPSFLEGRVHTGMIAELTEQQ